MPVVQSQHVVKINGLVVRCPRLGIILKIVIKSNDRFGINEQLVQSLTADLV